MSAFKFKKCNKIVLSGEFKTAKNLIAEFQKFKSLAKGDQRLVFIYGRFNVVHPGHLRLIRFAKESGDILIVGVLSDSQCTAAVKEAHRLEGIEAISWVDHAFLLNDSSPIEFIKEVKPHTVIKGGEHANLDNPEQGAIEAYGGKLIFYSGDISFSSIDYLREEFRVFDPSTINIPHDYLRNHDIKIEKLQEILRCMKQLRVLVIGDSIADEYITCDPIGMSQEDPTIVVTPLFSERYAGGASIVSAHAKGLGSKVHFFSVVGKDDSADFIRKKMESYGVDAHLYHDESRPTTLKQRYRASDKTLLRVSHIRHHPINREFQTKIFNSISDVIHDIDLLIFSDFNYGCLPLPLIEKISALCKEKNIFMAADNQCSSQVGDLSVYRGMGLLTPTEKEARNAMRDYSSGLIVLTEALQKKTQAENILLTLGKEGVLIHKKSPDEAKWLTDRLPAMNHSPKDPAGAGDSMLTSCSMALSLGYNIWESALIGSLAASVQVGRIGNIPLNSLELNKEILAIREFSTMKHNVT